MPPPLPEHSVLNYPAVLLKTQRKFATLRMRSRQKESRFIGKNIISFRMADSAAAVRICFSLASLRPITDSNIRDQADLPDRRELSCAILSSANTALAMIPLLIRIACVAFLSALAFGSITGIVFLLRPSHSVQVRKFDVLTGTDSQKAEAAIISQMIAVRIP
jgi:hypothetical protein